MTLYSKTCPMCANSMMERSVFCRKCFHIVNMPTDPQKQKGLMNRVKREQAKSDSLKAQATLEAIEAESSPLALTCLECGFKTLRSLQTHIDRDHGLRLTEYYTKYKVDASSVIPQEIRQKLSEAILGDKNPAYQHGGKFSPFSKKFIKYETEADAESARKLLFAKTGAAQASHGNTKIQYYLNKGMSQTEAKVALTERQQTFSLSKCIERLGEVEGTKQWQERQDKWQSTLNSKSDEELEDINRRKIYKSGVSKVSKKLFSLLDCVGSRHFGRDKELCIKNIDSSLKKKYIFVDFALGTKVIEFYGSYWHADPRKYDKDDTIFISKSKHIKVADIWQADQIRESIIRDNGYTLLIIWEHDYMTDPDKVIAQCKTFLHS